MACSGCSTGRGCGTLSAGCRNNGNCGTSGCNKLDVFDWLSNMALPTGQKQFNYVEVRFKNSRKEIYYNDTGVPLNAGEPVAVEASSGHDVGFVSLTGELVRIQMNHKDVDKEGIRKVYRKAKDTDIDKWQEAQDLEEETMLGAREITTQHKLDMKICDVEYQGDKTRATFYYTAEKRVDFRELIKSLSTKFDVRIDMRQIGARQEAAKLGGIGDCGRELCCSTWLTDFRSVTTSAARYQQLSLNPVKLAGQCGKLKCCLNYELDSYLDAIKGFPNTDKKIETKKGLAFHQKTDIFKKMMWYSYEDEPGSFIPIPVDRVIEALKMNEEGKKPADLKQFMVIEEVPDVEFDKADAQDSITRFDNTKKKKRRPGRHRKKGGGRNRNRNRESNRRR